MVKLDFLNDWVGILMVARAYFEGMYLGRIDYVEGYSNGWVTCVIRAPWGWETRTLPYAGIEITFD